MVERQQKACPPSCAVLSGQQVRDVCCHQSHSSNTGLGLSSCTEHQCFNSNASSSTRQPTRLSVRTKGTKPVTHIHPTKVCCIRVQTQVLDYHFALSSISTETPVPVCLITRQPMGLSARTKYPAPSDRVVLYQSPTPAAVLPRTIITHHKPSQISSYQH